MHCQIQLHCILGKIKYGGRSGSQPGVIKAKTSRVYRQIRFWLKGAHTGRCIKPCIVNSEVMNDNHQEAKLVRLLVESDLLWCHASSGPQSVDGSRIAIRSLCNELDNDRSIWVGASHKECKPSTRQQLSDGCTRELLMYVVRHRWICRLQNLQWSLLQAELLTMNGQSSQRLAKGAAASRQCQHMLRIIDAEEMQRRCERLKGKCFGKETCCTNPHARAADFAPQHGLAAAEGAGLAALRWSRAELTKYFAHWA